MEILNETQVLESLCLLSKKYGMYIGFIYGEENMQEITKAAPYLNPDEHYQIIADGRAWILFDSEKEMDDCYKRTVGDDGPTELNPYNGNVSVYAVTCSPQGELMNENT